VEINLDNDHQIFVMKHKDQGSMMQVLREHKIVAMYDYSAGEYIFYNRTDYHAAMLLV
jgi:hypothetical protein